ncbi:methylase involved in ubiquinone/menaquinone biosynthesis [Desulfosporosinus acidiphilus SJ4]|uniref:Methylase involved in ubiquinone/menaquinone biosynthesis n=1 Tax=Desulfosporosinus acidiphilus (strain DSM 22704 / JCM 16185 / SJ4) TaxID=646529 RepID=I4D0G3_DESAJ|nr:methyltransferase domain-containing protein [Desulfosporosinus acidiphilus]AFM39287.1 methylase involved in ubiquinone/menaquinone biosynthesis [Desulfosporosinus acidiphilus SJ4]
MAHKFNPANKKKLDDPWRRQNLPPISTLQELGLSPDDTVADIGCGIGYFTIPAAEFIASSNSTFALDTSEEMLAEVEKRSGAAGVLNIVLVKTEEYDLKLPNESVSFAILVNVLHEIDNKIQFLEEINRIVKTGGKIALIDWEKKKTEMGPPLDHRLSSEDVKGLLQRTGWELIKEVSLAEVFYGLVAVK